jgi:hypothetical protein
MRDPRDNSVGREFDWDLGVALYSEYDDDNFLGAQIDGYGGDQSGVPTSELQYTFGFLSRPADPTYDAELGLDVGCALLQAYDGNDVHSWLGSDPRTVALLPQLQKGASMQYDASGSFCTLDPVNHQWTCYVVLEQDPNTLLATKAVLMQAGLDSNSLPSIMLIGAPSSPGGSAPRIDIIDQEITLASPSASNFVHISDSGITISGALKTTSLDSGPSGTAGTPLAKSAELLVWAGLVNGALQALGQTIAPLSPSVATVTSVGT